MALLVSFFEYQINRLYLSKLLYSNIHLKMILVLLLVIISSSNSFPNNFDIINENNSYLNNNAEFSYTVTNLLTNISNSYNNISNANKNISDPSNFLSVNSSYTINNDFHNISMIAGKIPPTQRHLLKTKSDYDIIFNPLNFNKTYTCNYNSSDVYCENCLPYDYYLQTTCVSCESLIPNCKNCYMYGCEECFEGYSLYVTDKTSVPLCSKKQLDCKYYYNFTTRYNEYIDICHTSQDSITLIPEVSLNFVLIVCAVILAFTFIIVTFGCIYHCYVKKNNNDIVFLSKNHLICSLCSKSKVDMEKDYNNNKDNARDYVISDEGIDKSSSNIKRRSNNYISTTNKHSNIQLQEVNKIKEEVEAQFNKKLNCGGFLCFDCEKKAEEILLTGEYKCCTTCYKLVIWFVSNTNVNNGEIHEEIDDNSISVEESINNSIREEENNNNRNNNEIIIHEVIEFKSDNAKGNEDKDDKVDTDLQNKIHNNSAKCLINSTNTLNNYLINKTNNLTSSVKTNCISVSKKQNSINDSKNENNDKNDLKCKSINYTENKINKDLGLMKLNVINDHEKVENIKNYDNKKNADVYLKKKITNKGISNKEVDRLKNENDNSNNIADNNLALEENINVSNSNNNNKSKNNNLENINTHSNLNQNQYCTNNNNNNININKVKKKEKETCVVCFRRNPDAVIPCDNKPKHKLHKRCLADFYFSNNNSSKFNCPICRSELCIKPL